MTTSTLSVPGARLHVIDEGDPADPPVVLLHAGIADLRAWDPVVPLLVEAGYRVVRFDQRGYGRTEADDVPFSNRADVLAVLDGLGIERAALVGNSRGGVIAIDTAIDAPDRIVAVAGVAAGISGFASDVGPEEEAAFERMEALEERLASTTAPSGKPSSTSWSSSSCASGSTGRHSRRVARRRTSGMPSNGWIARPTRRAGSWASRSRSSHAPWSGSASWPCPS